MPECINRTTGSIQDAVNKTASLSLAAFVNKGCQIRDWPDSRRSCPIAQTVPLHACMHGAINNHCQTTERADSKRSCSHKRHH